MMATRIGFKSLLPDGAFAVERRAHHFGGHGLVADHHLDRRPGLRGLDGDVSHAYALLETRTHGAARHFARGLASDAQLVVRTGKAPFLQHESDELLAQAL